MPEDPGPSETRRADGVEDLALGRVAPGGSFQRHAILALSGDQQRDHHGSGG